MYKFKDDEIIILLGAGASVEAGIPHAGTMMNNVENLVNNDWNHLRDLYNYLKSTLIYAKGIIGQFDGASFINIERLVGTLDELRKRDQHPLFPFVGAWNPKLIEVAGVNFEHVDELYRRIVQELRHRWIEPTYHEHGDYFNGLLRLQNQLQLPLRIFTLNYDLCVERACGGSSKIELGFDEDKIWDFRRFLDSEVSERPLYLYKLHGSTDWKYDGPKLTYVSSPSHIPDDKAAIIFGTSYKLQYVDPFLFYAYEFRRLTLENAKLIITIGYGFGDDHINGMLVQALQHDDDRRLLCIAGPADNRDQKEVEEKARIIAALDKDKVNPDQVECWCIGAKEFLTDIADIDKLAEEFVLEKDDFIEELGVDVVSSLAGIDGVLHLDEDDEEYNRMDDALEAESSADIISDNVNEDEMPSNGELVDEE